MIMNHEKSLKERWIQDRFFKPVRSLLIFLARLFIRLRIVQPDPGYWGTMDITTQRVKARNRQGMETRQPL